MNSNPYKWSTHEVRRWLENEGYKEFWPFLEDEAPILGLDLLSLTSDDWHKILEEKRNLHKCPSVIKVRRLLNSIARLKSSSQQLVGHNGHAAKPISKHDSDAEIVRSSDDEELDAKASTCVYCHGVKVKKSQSEFKPERWKTLLAFLYALMVSWVSAFVMVIVHDRVPDMDKYPPLPDIILDNIPHIPWAFEMCEVTAMMLFIVWCLVVLFHKHRFIIMRRFFSLCGTIFLLRCITMLITSLSVPGTHLECTPRPYGDIWNKIQSAYSIWSGGGMTLQGVRTCGDYMFSGHTVTLTLLNFFITEYTSKRIYILHTFTWICNVFGVFFILAAHEHYSIDVFVAFYITSRLFMYYHTLANQTKPNRDVIAVNKISYETHRTWFWFPMFSFFESEIDCKIPNEFEFPITMSSIQEFYQDLWSHFTLKAQSTVPTQENEPAKVTTTRNVTRKKAKAKQT